MKLSKELIQTIRAVQKHKLVEIQEARRNAISTEESIDAWLKTKPAIARLLRNTKKKLVAMRKAIEALEERTFGRYGLNEDLGWIEDQAKFIKAGGKPYEDPPRPVNPERIIAQLAVCTGPAEAQAVLGSIGILWDFEDDKAAMKPALKTKRECRGTMRKPRLRGGRRSGHFGVSHID